MVKERQRIMLVYRTAYDLWCKKKLSEAAQILQDFWHASGMKSLQGMLLMAYIMRDQKRYISEVKVLEELFERFADSGEYKLLADAWSMLGSVLRRLGDSQLSVEAFKKSVELEPDSEQKLVDCSNALFSANAIDGVTADYMQSLYALYRNLLRNLSITPYPTRKWNHQKIRVGYVSPDLRDHAVAQFVWPLFCQYDKERFSVYAYALTKRPDWVTAALQQKGAIWREVSGENWQEIARQIRDDEIDILVDLAGHSAENALPVFAWRPAMIQLSGIGYFNSTGMDEMQWFLSDVYCSDDETSPYFTERLLRLPKSHFCYRPLGNFPEVGQSPCRKNGYVTFGCFNNFAKVNDGMLMVWKKILEAVPNSRLLLKHSLLGTEEGREYTVQRLKKLGMPLTRIEFRGLSKDYLAQYHDMDIALDTSPYPGGLTTCEALYMGVPVVTLKGNRHGARFGYSFLANLGLEELVAESVNDYIDIAVKLASDTNLLELLRKNMRRIMQASPLMDSEAYMGSLERMYQNILQKFD
ncbi:tetratricopeptide repeat protein [Selenomonas ruminantium]|uniref:O-linked N-acetylglucosamine transferase, SPINDLY family protein n=1 Tax=Selenomonas ruminantium TaxID=971 RepID=UPI000691AE6E|nr:tetratricopeptide repeat protein [Selenomonas ruminantium]